MNYKALGSLDWRYLSKKKRISGLAMKQNQPSSSQGSRKNWENNEMKLLLNLKLRELEREREREGGGGWFQHLIFKSFR